MTPRAAGRARHGAHARGEARAGVGGSTGTKPGRRAGAGERGGPRGTALAPPPHAPTATAHGAPPPGLLLLPSFTEAPASNRRTAAGPGDGRRGAPVLPGRQTPRRPPTHRGLGARSAAWPQPGGKRAAAGGAAASRGPPPGHASPGRGPARDSASARAAPTGRRPGSPAGKGGRGRARIPDARRSTTTGQHRRAARDRDPPPTHNPGRPHDRVRREGSPPRGAAAATALSASSPLSLSRGRGRPPPRHRPPPPHTRPPTSHSRHRRADPAGRGGGGGPRAAGTRGTGRGARGRPPCLHLGGRRAPADPGPARTNPQPRHPPGATDPWGERLIVKRRSDRRSPGRNPGPQVRSKCR